MIAPPTRLGGGWGIGRSRASRNVSSNVDVDVTALDALDELREELARRGIVLVLARVKQELREDLAGAGFLDRLGADRVFMTLPTAVTAYGQ